MDIQLYNNVWLYAEKLFQSGGFRVFHGIVLTEIEIENIDEQKDRIYTLCNQLAQRFELSLFYQHRIYSRLIKSFNLPLNGYPTNIYLQDIAEMVQDIVRSGDSSVRSEPVLLETLLRFIRTNPNVYVSIDSLVYLQFDAKYPILAISKFLYQWGLIDDYYADLYKYDVRNSDFRFAIDGQHLRLLNLSLPYSRWYFAPPTHCCPIIEPTSKTRIGMIDTPFESFFTISDDGTLLQLSEGETLIIYETVGESRRLNAYGPDGFVKLFQQIESKIPEFAGLSTLAPRVMHTSILIEDKRNIYNVLFEILAESPVYVDTLTLEHFARTIYQFPAFKLENGQLKYTGTPDQFYNDLQMLFIILGKIYRRLELLKYATVDPSPEEYEKWYTGLPVVVDYTIDITPFATYLGY